MPDFRGDKWKSRAKTGNYQFSGEVKGNYSIFAQESYNPPVYTFYRNDPSSCVKYPKKHFKKLSF